MTLFRLTLCLFAAAGPALAQDAQRGADLFATYCASCHGDDAMGAGRMSEILTVTPPDLTRLSARNGGVFPTQSVVFRIDGRDPLLAHGGPMPFFGDVLEETTTPMKAETGQPIMAGTGIADLVAFLEARQL